jgi:hypothetical protein
MLHGIFLPAPTIKLLTQMIAHHLRIFTPTEKLPDEENNLLND